MGVSFVKSASDPGSSTSVSRLFLNHVKPVFFLVFFLLLICFTSFREQDEAYMNNDDRHWWDSNLHRRSTTVLWTNFFYTLTLLNVNVGM